MFSHVVVVGVDGAGAFFKQADTPNFDRIFRNGAVTYRALSSRPTMSAECWGSMLLGVSPDVHKLTNDVVESTRYDVHSPFPSLFRRIKEKMPEAELGSFCDWNPITHGIVEDNLGVSHDSKPDGELTPIICDYIRTKKPTFLFVQFDSVDATGHKCGYGTDAYLDSIHRADLLLNDIHCSLSDAGIINETLFIVIADHGGVKKPDGTGDHGGWTDTEKFVTFAASGKGIMKGGILHMNIRDLAAIVLFSLGIEIPAFSKDGWTSQLPKNLFENVEIPEYKDIEEESS